MALESSDLSDGSILESTQQFQNGNGQVQFKIVLPSGRELESEWLQPDMKKKAMVAWLDVVKQQAMEDADQARAEAREQAMKERRNAALQEQKPTPDIGFTDSPTVAPSTIQTQTTLNASGNTSPDSFVDAGLKAAQADYDHWNQVALDAVGRVQLAAKNIEKWINIKKALEGDTTNAVIRNSDSDSGSGRSGSSTGGGTTRRRRKRVAKSTDFQVTDATVLGT
jgi:hypothetical protein